jgi:hypothetical protein
VPPPEVTPHPSQPGCFSTDAPVIEDLPAPSLGLNYAQYWPHYNIFRINFEFFHSPEATCSKIDVLDQARNGGHMEAIGSDYAVLKVAPGTWTARAFVGNETGRSEWSNTLVVEIPEMSEGQCRETPSFGHNTSCDITYLVSVASGE